VPTSRIRPFATAVGPHRHVEGVPHDGIAEQRRQASQRDLGEQRHERDGEERQREAEGDGQQRAERRSTQVREAAHGSTGRPKPAARRACRPPGLSTCRTKRAAARPSAPGLRTAHSS
jgi:hypothetical protein